MIGLGADDDGCHPAIVGAATGYGTAMTEPQSITADHVRTLLTAAEPATLVLLEGRVDVVAADRLATDEWAGALEVISRDELVERVGPQPGEADLEREAAALTASVQQLGG